MSIHKLWDTWWNDFDKYLRRMEKNQDSGNVSLKGNEWDDYARYLIRTYSLGDINVISELIDLVNKWEINGDNFSFRIMGDSKVTISEVATMFDWDKNAILNLIKIFFDFNKRITDKLVR